MNDGLLQCSCHETSPGLGYQDFRLLPELPFQPVVGLLRHSQHLFRIGQGIHVRHYVVLMLKQSYCYIPFREMEPLFVSFVDGGGDFRYSLLHVLAVRHTDLSFIWFPETVGNLAYERHLCQSVVRLEGDYRHSEHS